MSTNDYAEHASAAVAALADDARLGDVELVIEQRIVDGTEVVASYHLRFGDGGLQVVDGGAADPDVVLTVDRVTADAMRRGEAHAHRAFLTGRLRLDGDIDRLLAHGALLGELVASLGRSDA